MFTTDKFSSPSDMRDNLDLIGRLRFEIKEANRKIEIERARRDHAIDMLVAKLELTSAEAKKKLEKSTSNLILFSILKVILEHSIAGEMTSSELLESVRKYRKTNSNSFRSALSRFRKAGLLSLDRGSGQWSLLPSISVSQSGEN
ncbi:MAG: hypothetical protein ABJG15_10845 [Hyphomonadaceae bacterium]